MTAARHLGPRRRLGRPSRRRGAAGHRRTPWMVAATAVAAGLALGLSLGLSPSTAPAGSGRTLVQAPRSTPTSSVAGPAAHRATGTTISVLPHDTSTTVPPSPTTTRVPATTTTEHVQATTTTTVPVTTTTAPHGCASALPAQLASTGGGTQLVTVEASGYGTTYATLTAWSREGRCWSVAYGPYLARLGSSGLEPAARKREGDGATPEGRYGFGPVMYGNARNPGVHYPYHSLVCGDWWDEDPESPQYNLFVHWPCGSTPPFAQGSAGAGSEALWTETTPYPSFAVIAYNTSRTPWRGSAIFLHAGTAYPTAGCVSIAQSYLDLVLGWLDPSRSPAIAIGTSADIGSF